MIIRTNTDDANDPKAKSEDLWDGQLCLGEDPNGQLFIWDEEANEPHTIGGTFVGRGDAKRYLNEPEGFRELYGTIGDILYERDEAWTVEEIEGEDLCRVPAQSADLGCRFLARKIFNYIKETHTKGLPDEHFAASVI